MGTVDKIGNLFALNFRMIDVETGIITKATTFDCVSCEIGDVVTNSLPEVL